MRKSNPAPWWFLRYRGSMFLYTDKERAKFMADELQVCYFRGKGQMPNPELVIHEQAWSA